MALRVAARVRMASLDERPSLEGEQAGLLDALALGAHDMRGGDGGGADGAGADGADADGGWTAAAPRWLAPGPQIQYYAARAAWQRQPRVRQRLLEAVRRRPR